MHRSWSTRIYEYPFFVFCPPDALPNKHDVVFVLGAYLKILPKSLYNTLQKLSVAGHEEVVDMKA